MGTKIFKNSEYDRKRAKESVGRFVKRFGESYLLIAYHAALPLILTPELLNYLRNKFLRGKVPWVAEVDLLLSDLCRQVGYELYEMDIAVRAYLIDKMFKEKWGPERMHEVSRLLIQYLHHFSRTNPFIGENELQAQQWAAMVYLEDQRENVVRQIAKTFQNCLTSSSSSFDAVSLSRVVQAIAPHLKEHPAILKYALFTSSLSTELNSIEDKTAQFRKMFGHEHDVTIAGISLPGPERLFEELTGYEKKKTTYIRKKKEDGILSILIVFSDELQLLSIEGILQYEFSKRGLDVFIDKVMNESDAKKRLEVRKYKLIITHLHIPADHKSPLMEEERRGIALLQSLGKEGIEIPSILISPLIDKYLLKTRNELYFCQLVSLGATKWEKKLIAASKKALQEVEIEQEREEEKWGNIDIFLESGKNYGAYTIKIDVNQTEIHGSLNISVRNLIDLEKSFRKSLAGFSISNLDEELANLGKRLWKEIFENNPKFVADFNELIGKVGGLEYTRIRFVGDRLVSFIFSALEFMIVEHEHLMLKAPICRGLPGIRSLYPALLSDQETQGGLINFLIIEANVHGLLSVEQTELALRQTESPLRQTESPFEQTELVKLYNIKQEARFLSEFVSDKMAKIGVAKVHKIHGETCSKELVEELLTKKGPWHLVHYAGHSFFEGKSNVGYVFFPGNGAPDAVDIRKFSMWLRAAKTRFIYLSACATSGEDLIFEVARNGIPAVMGFRWDVNDQRAVEFAKYFYMHLFEGKPLEHVLLEARRYFYSEYKEPNLWASPTLFLA